MIWFRPVSLDEINQRAQNSLCSHLAIVFTEITPHSLTAKMPVDPRTMQPVGILHGGASCALAETVGSAAGNYCIDQTREICVGLEINVNHLRMVSSGEIIGIASPIHLGKKTQVWEIRMNDEENRLIAISRLTLMVIRKKNPEENSGVSKD